MEKSDYSKYRGKCKEFSEALCAEDPSLTLVRGYYYCHIWDRQEPHWWTVNAEGEIIDPTAKQFPSKGTGEYIPFDGTYTCENCGKIVAEAQMVPCGNYPTCSNQCAMRLVGL